MNMNFIIASSEPDLPDRPHLDAATAGHRRLRSPLDGLVEIARLGQQESAQLLLRFGKWAIGGKDLAVPHADSRRRLDRLQRMGHDEVAGLPERVVVSQALFGAGI